MAIMSENKIVLITFIVIVVYPLLSFETVIL